MKTNQPSRTAHLVAMSRAAHQLLDVPKVFDDPIAVKIIGEENIREITSHPEHYTALPSTLVRAFLVARSKYVEDTLSKAVQRRTNQYVILGAGMDTFSYRNPFPEENLRIFEVDHPSTQAWKKEWLEKAKISIPDPLSFVPVDFDNDVLEVQLHKSGFDSTSLSFFSWVGVTMYLSPETIKSTLKSILDLSASGSEIVFDYMVSPSLLDPDEQVSYKVRAERVASVGEPWKSTFIPDELGSELKNIGFAVLDDVGAEELNELYFKDRSDSLRVDSRARVVHIQR